MRVGTLWCALWFGCAAPSEPAQAPERAEAAPRATVESSRSSVAPSSPAAASAPSEPARASLPTKRAEVVLVPLGRFPDDLLDAVEDRLERELAVEVRRHDPVPLPQSAWYAPRKRYRADALLDHLAALLPDGAPETTRMLGLTEVDISTTKEPYEDWGIFGLGQMPGRTAVVSMFRLERKARDREHLRFRVSIVALHEAGHTFGLDHCGEPHCPMQDAEGSIANTDSSNEALGPECRAEIDAAYPIAHE
jgi:archaemetzincin